MEMVDGRSRLHRGMFISLVIHAFCVAGILFFVTLTAQHPEMVQVLLTLEPPGGGGGCGAIREAPAESKKVPSKLARAALPRHSPCKQLRLSNLPPAMDKAAVEPAEDVVPLIDKTPVPSVAPLPASSSVPHAEAAESAAAVNSGEGRGFGGGKGAGIGTGSGSGRGSGEGISDGPGKGRESLESLRNRYLREHFAYIRDLILKNLTYPPMARKVGWQGKVKVSFIIKEDGRVEGIRIIESSGYRLLDRNVVETIHDVQPFPKPPVRAELIIPVAYVLKL